MIFDMFNDLAKLQLLGRLATRHKSDKIKFDSTSDKVKYDDVILK